MQGMLRGVMLLQHLDHTDKLIALAAGIRPSGRRHTVVPIRFSFR
jgi:hypothetical protein